LLESNDYNPNHVHAQEMALLAFSLQKQGWIQPILVWPKPEGQGYLIIDGFHRHMLVKTNKKVWALTEGKVPVVVMDMTEAERKLLTVRINRAKGSHAAFKMHEIVVSCIKDHDMSVAQVCQEIGADLDEVNALLAENVFEKKQVDKFNYSRAWVPPQVKVWGMVPTPPEAERG
jgi:ParB-like chromosome segregation protein Spo0J